MRRIQIPLVLLIAAAVAGCDRSSETPVDVDAGGHRLHLLVVGEGHQKPTVILESGGRGGIGWQNTRNQIAQFAQVITYDRAGTGQSEPGPEPRDARTIARDLHAALQRAGVAPPYVLVGQSLGGLYVQVFAAEYPQETAGLVLVDPAHASVDLCLSMDEVKAWYMIHQPGDWPRVQAACRGVPDGVQRFFACKHKLMESYLQTVPEPRRSTMRGEWWAMIDTILAASPKPAWNEGGSRREVAALTDSMRQAIAARPLPKVPTILLAAGKIDLDEMPADALTPNVLALQAEAKRWGMAAYQKWIDDTPGAKLVLVQDSRHNIESDRPQAVIDAVREVVR